MKNSKFRLLIYLLILGSLIIQTSCNSLDNANKKPVKIGVILPLTGELASYGVPMKQGIDLALSELNHSGDSIHYALSYVDSKAQTVDAVNGLQNLISIQDVKFVIGDISSSTTLAMAPIAARNKVFLLSPGASSPKLHNINSFFARNYPSSAEESVSSAKFIYDQLHQKETALVYVNNEYGLGLAEAFQRSYLALGGKISFEEAYAYEQSDFRTLILKLKQANPRLVYLGGNQKEMGKFMKQYADAGMKTQIVSDISFLEPDCLKVAGKAAEGVFVPVPYYNPQDSSMKGAFNFGQSYFKRFKTYPSVAVSVGYDALMLMAKGITQTHGQPQQAANYIRNLKNYDGAMGRISFSNGDVSVPVVFKTVKNGKVLNYQ